jgi:radical SAM protein with 4Fe4S-binding SPASM domain
MHEFKVGDLLKDDIFDIVNSPQFRSFASRRKDLPKECRESDCEYIEKCRGGCSARSYLVYGNLDSKDPYCPKDYVKATGTEPDLPKRPEIGCHNGIRVHDNYLCTWIGEVNPEFKAPEYPSLERYRTRRPNLTPLSGCQQEEEKSGPSLVRLRVVSEKEVQRTTVAGEVV